MDLLKAIYAVFEAVFAMLKTRHKLYVMMHTSSKLSENYTF